MIRLAFAPLILLAVYVISGPAALAQSVEGRVIEYGLFDAVIATKEETPGTISGRTNRLSNLEHIRTVEEFVGQLGVHFGLRFALSGDIAPGDPITFRVIHPPLRHPENGRGGPIDVWRSQVGIDLEDQYVGYTFEHPWELAEGEWIFEVIHEGRILLRQRFMVRVPLN